MTILITGGSGFIGTNLVDFYRQHGVDVVNLDICPPRNAAHQSVWQRVDIRDRSVTRKIITSINPQICFHLAARTDLDGKSLDDYSANIEGVQNVVDALAECAALQFAVFASSMLVCRIGYRPTHEQDYCPSTPYGESKVDGERIVREHASGRFPWVMVRPTSIWGPWFAAPYRDFFTAVRRGVYAHPRGKRIRRSYGYVGNTVFQLERLRAEQGGPLVGKTVYIADYTPVELLEWGRLIQQAFGARRFAEVPLALFRAAAWLGDGLKAAGLRFPVTSFRLQNMLTETVHDTGPLANLTGPLPYDTPAGVALTCAWMQQQAL